MVLRVDEIEPGIVAYLDTAVLLRDSRLSHENHDKFRSGPFLCVAFGPGKTVWLKLTSKPGRYNHRFEIRSEWKLHGSRLWKTQPTYLNNPGEPFIARDVVFVDASRSELPFLFQRARIVPEGIDAVVAEMCHRNNVLAP